MDPDIARLIAVPGTHDLSLPEVAEVLQLSECTIARLCRKGRLENKRHNARGDGSKPRVRISRAAVVRYLVQSSTGNKEVILSAIAAQCPQYLPAVQGLTAPAGPVPANVIPISSGRTRRPQNDRLSGHPDLFAAL